MLGGKADVRVAIAVTKADLLPFADRRDLRVELGPDSSRKEWRRAVRDVSRASRQLLLDLGERAFVTAAESEFREVGFFFVSSLGRDVEVLVELMPNPSAPSEVDRSVPVLKKRISLSRDGTRQPNPQNVLLPLFWILLGQA